MVIPVRNSDDIDIDRDVSVDVQSSEPKYIQHDSVRDEPG